MTNKKGVDKNVLIIKKKANKVYVFSLLILTSIYILFTITHLTSRRTFAVPVVKLVVKKIKSTNFITSNKTLKYLATI